MKALGCQPVEKYIPFKVLVSDVNLHPYSKVFQRLLLGIQDLHQVGIAHRDLKLENLLLANKSDLTTVKICDLGRAVQA